MKKNNNMKLFNVKKAFEINPLSIIMVFIILLIVAAIVLYGFRTTFGKQTEFAKETLEKTTTSGDKDQDGIIDMFDSCPDDPTNKCNENKDTAQKTT